MDGKNKHKMCHKICWWIDKNQENVTVIIQEQPNSTSFYVALFEKNLLNPKHNIHFVLRKTRDSFREYYEIWFCYVRVGRDILSMFYKLSQMFSMSQIYTTHSIRAAGVTLLSECRGFTDTQIMSVAEHNSGSDLANYQFFGQR